MLKSGVLTLINIHLYFQARWFMTNNPCDFVCLRHLHMEVLVDGNPGCSSGILRLASLLELTPVLEVFNLHVSNALLHSLQLHEYST